MVLRLTGGPRVGVERPQPHPLHRRHDEIRDAGRRPPILHIRRRQEGLVTVKRHIGRHAKSGVTPHHTTQYHDSVRRQSDRLLGESETLREGGITSAENESSVVLLGDLGSCGILLTGDAGLKALGAAADYARALGIELSKLWLFQVPHHGSRNNISPSMLNRIIGPPIASDATRRPHCIISAGAEDEEHPRQVVVNALWRRGLKPCVTRTGTVRFHSGLKARDDRTTVTPIPFSTTVERSDQWTNVAVIY